jgi:hypothetical protein
MLQAGRSRVRFPMRLLDFLNWLKSSSRTMALGSTQPLTDMSTRNLPGGKGRLARKTDNLTAICEPILQKMWEPRRLTTLWASTASYRDSFTFFFLYITFGADKMSQAKGYNLYIRCYLQITWIPSKYCHVLYKFFYLIKPSVTQDTRMCPRGWILDWSAHRWKGCGRKRLRHHLRNCSVICLENIQTQNWLRTEGIWPGSGYGWTGKVEVVFARH